MPGQGSNPGHHRDGAGSLTHCTTAGTPSCRFLKVLYILRLLLSVHWIVRGTPKLPGEEESGSDHWVLGPRPPSLLRTLALGGRKWLGWQDSERQ